MRWDMGRMIRPPQANGLDADRMRTIQGLSGTLAQPAQTSFGSGIQLPGASPSSQAIANFANLAPQQPGTGWNSQPQYQQPQYPQQGGGQPAYTSQQPQSGGQPGGLFTSSHEQQMNTPYSQAAIAGGMTQGDIWSNPAFANAVAAAGPGGLFGSSGAPNTTATPMSDADLMARRNGVAAAMAGQPAADTGQIGDASWFEAVRRLGQPQAT